MTLAHISFTRRPPDLGGVPKFAAYLAERFGAERICWDDYPYRTPALEHRLETEKAVLLSSWAWQAGRLTAERIVGDGFWLAGLPHRAPGVVVCHGTWAQMSQRIAPVRPELIGQQNAICHRFPVVAVSEDAAAGCREHYRVEPQAVIPNGVDTALFHPGPHEPNHRPIVLHAARTRGKGLDLVQRLAAMLPEFEFRYLAARLGEEPERFRAGDVFLHPSRHEGDSYAILEALATGLPCAVSAVGRFAGRSDFAGGVIVDNFDPEAWAEAVRYLVAARATLAPAARDYAVREANLDTWERRWREFLEGL